MKLDVKVWGPSIITLFEALGNVFVNSVWEELLHARKTFQADEIPMRFFESDKHKEFFGKPSYADHISVKEKFIHAKVLLLIVKFTPFAVCSISSRGCSSCNFLSQLKLTSSAHYSSYFKLVSP